MANRADDDRGEYLAHLYGMQDEAWEEFLMTGRPAALAKYLEAEGEVDESVRNILIAILKYGPKLINRGGRDSWRDYLTYIEVNDLTRQYIETDRHDGEKPRPVSHTEACRLYAAKTNRELRAVEKQYERGEKIYGPNSDLFRKVDRDHEK